MTQDTGKRGPRGSGTVRERKPGYWEVRVPVRAADGRPSQVSRYVRGTRKDAERERRQLIDQVDKGHHRQRKKTVADLCERWFDLVSPDRSPRTTMRYRSSLDTHILPALGHLPLERLGPADIDQLYIELRRGSATKRPMKASSIGTVHQVIHTALRYGVEVGWLVVNPSDRAHPPQARSRPIEPPTWADVGTLVKVAMESRHEDMAVVIFLAAATGMRRGELSGLRWEHVNGSTVNVWQSVIDDGPRSTLVKETKHKRFRTIAIAPEVVPILEAHRRRMEDRAALAEVKMAPRPFVFSDRLNCGMPVSPSSMTNRFEKIRAKAGLPTVRLHDLRHLQATFLFERGYDAVEIGARLGHSGGALALNLYGHFSPARDTAAAASLGSVLPLLPPAVEILKPPATREDEG